jgi:chaperonin GroES
LTAFKELYFKLKQLIMSNQSSNPVKYLDPSVHCTYEDRCVIFPDAAEEVTKGGIIIPDTAKEKPKSGTVVLVGPKLEGVIFIGDHVQYGRYAGQVVKIDGVEYDSVRLTEFIVGRIVSKVESGDERTKSVMEA